MARYIDAGLLLENLKRQYGEELGWQCTVNMPDVGMMIEDAPTVDVVEVVRCKDCVLYNTEACPCTMYEEGDLISLLSENDYCSKGERRKSDEQVH